MWTFGKKIGAGFAISSLLLLAIGGVAYRGLTLLSLTSQQVTHAHQTLENISELLSLVKDAETGQRGFVITGDPAFLTPHQEALLALPQATEALRALLGDNPVQLKRLAEAERLINAKVTELKRIVEMRNSSGFDPSAKAVAAGDGKRLMDDLRAVIAQMDQEERVVLERRAAEVAAASSDAEWVIIWGTLCCLSFVTVAGAWLTRSLTDQISHAVQRMQLSSTELQAVANQQASGAQESSASMNEISTTISELLATSRQIAESAQRVSAVAEQTADAARSGDGTVRKASDSILGIRRQVDLVVNHMLELGTKSQHIGGVLEIVSELAEQTNILAINASIEAVGAGESGRRFGVVADEIRKLADRVAGSTKEIRGLIEDVRSAVNTTVMATEIGSKAVDAGNREFGEVTSSFKQIADLVSTTTAAAREIELSTKQQTNAVEQVNVAIRNSAQATKEAEASSRQTLSTATEVAGLSRDLMRVVRPAA